MSEKCQSFSCICCWQPPSLTQHLLSSVPSPCTCSACFYLVRYVQAQAQTVNNSREQTTKTEPKNAPPLQTSKRRNKNTDEEKQCKKKELDCGVISEVEGAVGYVRTQELGRVGCFSAEQIRTPA